MDNIEARINSILDQFGGMFCDGLEQADFDELTTDIADFCRKLVVDRDKRIAELECKGDMKS